MLCDVRPKLRTGVEPLHLFFESLAFLGYAGKVIVGRFRRVHTQEATAYRRPHRRHCVKIAERIGCRA